MTTSARLIAATTMALLLAYFGPHGYWLVAQVRQRVPSFSYSAPAGDFVRMSIENGRPLYHGPGAEEITRERHEELTPFTSWVQLSKDGRLPSQVQGLAITPSSIRKAQSNLRLHAAAFDMPAIHLVPLYNAGSGRAKLEAPAELMRLGSGVEFLQVDTNTLYPAKAALYAAAFNREGLRLPARTLGYNPTTLKPYDEGCYIVDADGRLFLLRDHNGEPKLSLIPLASEGRTIIPEKVFVQEQENREWRAVVLGEDARLYLLHGPTFQVLPLPLGGLKAGTATVGLRSDPLHLHVTANDGDTLHITVLNRSDLSIVKSLSYVIDKEEAALRHQLFSCLFPVVIDVEARTSGYYGWQLRFSGWQAVPAMVLSAGCILLLLRRRRQPLRFTLGASALCLLLGPCAVPAVLLAPEA